MLESGTLESGTLESGTLGPLTSSSTVPAPPVTSTTEVSP